MASVILVLAGTATAHAAPLTGAVFTTDVACTGTDLNLYASKADVYLDGGPAGLGSAGLPDGQYYVRVTEPNGTLLGTSIGAINEMPAVVVGGEFVQCYQLQEILVRASDGTPGYDDTSNNGGEYKVWVCATADFRSSTCKTDNFKVDAEDVVVPPPLDACTEFEGRTVIHFDVRLQALGFHRSGAQLVDLPAGTYQITLQSFDDSHPRQADAGQEQEQWFAEFQTARGTVASTPISDLPGVDQTLNEVVDGALVIGAPVTAVSAVHVLEGVDLADWDGPHSIEPVCVAIDPVR